MKKGIAVMVLMFLVSWGQGYAQEAQAVAAEHEHKNVSETHYQCPMHPEVHQAEPGDCPECGMHLEPVAEVKQ